MDLSAYNIGVLALQGDFERHEHQIRLLGAKCSQVRLPSDLNSIDALIIPGGESTTMDILLDRFRLRQPLTTFGRSRPVYGTCAGMIMLAKRIEDNKAGVKTLGLIDIDVIRTGYGRQVFSFEEELPVNLNNGQHTLKATFIRAPIVTRIGGNVRILASYRNSPVLVSENNILVSSFHTELDDDVTVLSYFFRTFLERK
jgi:5'-phosphate synthase pdxT subunit